MPNADLPYMTPESRDKLIDFFKPENIIFLDKAELRAHCANFINFSNVVIASNPTRAEGRRSANLHITPQSFTRKMEEKGFHVIAPIFNLCTGFDSGLRCISQIIFEPERKRGLQDAEMPQPAEKHPKPDNSPASIEAKTAMKKIDQTLNP